jgi:hypothetical protein
MKGNIRRYEGTWVADYTVKSDNPNAILTLKTIQFDPHNADNVRGLIEGEERDFEIINNYAYIKHFLSKETLDELFEAHDPEDFIDEDSEDWERASLIDYIEEDTNEEYCGVLIEDKELLIELEDWDHECGDGCCYTYGVDIFVNGEQIENEDGTNPHQLLKAVLTKLGYTNVRVEYK